MAGYWLLGKHDSVIEEESNSRCVGSGSYLLVMCTPCTFNNTNNLVASSRAVIRHDRLVRGSCLDIGFCQMGGGRALQIRQIRIIGSTYKTGGTCAAAGAVQRLAEVWIRRATVLGSCTGGDGVVCGSSSRACQP